jgi:hypothetical protein
LYSKAAAEEAAVKAKVAKVKAAKAAAEEKAAAKAAAEEQTIALAESAKRKKISATFGWSILDMRKPLPGLAGVVRSTVEEARDPARFPAKLFQDVLITKSHCTTRGSRVIGASGVSPQSPWPLPTRVRATRLSCRVSWAPFTA